MSRKPTKSRRPPSLPIVGLDHPAPGLPDRPLAWDMASALADDVSRGGSDPLRVAVRDVLSVLTAKGLRAAYDAFNRHPGLANARVGFPALYTTRRETREGKVTGAGVFLLERRNDPALFALYLWHALTDVRVAQRIRHCASCDAFFLDTTKNRAKRYCSVRCASRATSRDYRAAGKERAARKAKRVTSQSHKSRRR
jgi:hypothetical protein